MFIGLTKKKSGTEFDFSGFDKNSLQKFKKKKQEMKSKVVLKSHKIQKNSQTNNRQKIMTNTY